MAVKCEYVTVSEENVHRNHIGDNRKPFFINLVLSNTL